MAHVFFYCCLTAQCCAHLHDCTPPFKLNRTLTDCLASREELSTMFLEDMLEVHQTGVSTFKEHAFLISKECFIHFLSHTKQKKKVHYIHSPFFGTATTDPLFCGTSGQEVDRQCIERVYVCCIHLWFYIYTNHAGQRRLKNADE